MFTICFSLNFMRFLYIMKFRGCVHLKQIFTESYQGVLVNLYFYIHADRQWCMVCKNRAL